MVNVLERPALVLNRQWQPVGVATVARTLVMLWNDSARVIDPETYQAFAWEEWIALPVHRDEPAIRGGRVRLRVPEVVALRDYDKTPTVAVTFSRRNIAKRDHATCQYCGAQPGIEAVTIDHVLPRSRGGASAWDNCVTACVSCNARKADRTPEEAGMPLKRKPARPTWRPLYASRDDRMPSWSRFLN